MEKYISVIELAERWNVSPRRIQVLCNENRIIGAKSKVEYGLSPMRQKARENEIWNKKGKEGNLECIIPVLRLWRNGFGV